MHLSTHVLARAASKISVNTTRSIISFSPVVLGINDRPSPLEVRVTIPSSGSALPIILLSHGQGRSNWLSSLEGYTPLAEFWAAHGFAVLQPTHLRSAYLGLQAPAGNEMFWKNDPLDMRQLLDNLDQVEAAVPGLKNRLDRKRVAVAGHSGGALATMLLLGAGNTDPRDLSKWHQPDQRIKAGIILAGPGKGGEDLTTGGQALLPFYDFDFSTMTTPALIVHGDEDKSPWFTQRDADWHGDAYHLAPGSKDLLVLGGGNHVLGGISGWDSRETVDESPERVAIVQRMCWAYLWSQLYDDEDVWTTACESFRALDRRGRVESRR